MEVKVFKIFIYRYNINVNVNVNNNVHGIPIKNVSNLISNFSCHNLFQAWNISLIWNLIINFWLFWKYAHCLDYSLIIVGPHIIVFFFLNLNHFWGAKESIFIITNNYISYLSYFKFLYIFIKWPLCPWFDTETWQNDIKPNPWPKGYTICQFVSHGKMWE